MGITIKIHVVVIPTEAVARRAIGEVEGYIVLLEGPPKPGCPS
jgi:hypothetical protein